MIRLINVSKKYYNKKEGEVYALKDCNVSFDNQSFVIITGKSGSGKTTLINLIGSLDTPTSGDIIYNEESLVSISNYYRNKVIGFIFQEHNLFDTLSVKENIRFSMELQGINVTDKEIIDVLEKVSLVDCIEKYPKELSTGQHQRCAIARALIKSPDVIIADEPTGSLDEKNGIQIIQLLKKLSEEYLVIMVTHNQEYPKTYADRHIVLENGVIVKDEIINDKILKLEERINKRPNDNEQRLKIRTKLNFIKKIFTYNLKHTIQSIIIFSISIFLINLFYSLTNINDSKIIYETISNVNSDKRYYINNILVKKNNHFYTEVNAGFHNQDIENMKEEYKNNILPIYRDKYISLEEYVNIPNNLLFKGDISGLLEINEDVLNNFGFELIEGNLPKNSSENLVEVAITKFLYEYIKEYGIGEFKVSKYEDILGKLFIYNDVSYKITGIVDTKYNINYFSDYFLKNNSNIEKHKLEEYKNLIDTEIHTAIFVPSNYLENIIPENSRSFRIKGLNDVFRINNNLNNNVTNQIFFVSKYTKDKKIVWEKTEQDSLNKHEVIIAKSLLNEGDINFRIKELISLYAQEHFNEISNEFKKQFPNSNHLVYADYILSHQTNSYNADKSYEYFQSVILKEVMQEINNENPTINISSINGMFKDKIDVVGIDLLNSDTIIVSDENFKLIKNISLGPYNSILIKSTNNYNDDAKFIKSHLYNNNIENSILYSYYNFKTVHHSLYIYTVFLIIFFILITVILIFYYVNDLFKSERKNIGLFLALGTNKNDIKQIYFTIISVTMLFSQIFGLLIFIVLVPIFNSFIRNKYNLYADIIHLNFQSVIYTIAITTLFYSIFIVILMKIILNNKSIKNLYYQ